MTEATAPREHANSIVKARTLRKRLTPTEAMLWARLRSNRLLGVKFRRQHPLGPYVVDFCCESLRLVVEIDGDSHAGQVEYDMRRTAWLEQRGYRVLRFTNRQVMNEMSALVEAIWRACDGEATQE